VVEFLESFFTVAAVFDVTGDMCELGSWKVSDDEAFKLCPCGAARCGHGWILVAL
jgi:hypothetical protein